MGGMPPCRMSSDLIGCSLAEAAESPSYERYLAEASGTPNSVHVVYINTSLRTKARADALVPTITCTSSNVVQTVLQAFAQVPGANVWYGPDTYMGRNLAALFTSLAQMPDEEVKRVHPEHTQQTIRDLLPRLRHFDDGTCIVHHLFGGEVCTMVRELYSDAYITAHFEVPGEMFALAMEAQRTRGMGVVGSTQNILDFIAARVTEASPRTPPQKRPTYQPADSCANQPTKLQAAARPFPDRLQFVLGTESGMITSIVRKVQALLQEVSGPPPRLLSPPCKKACPCLFRPAPRGTRDWKSRSSSPWLPRRSPPRRPPTQSSPAGSRSSPDRLPVRPLDLVSRSCGRR